MLTQQQRIEISKKIISIPQEIQTAQKTKLILQTVEIPKAVSIDQGNKVILDLREPIINGYQSELTNLDGNGRTQIIEQNYIDASERKLGNLFFYNQIGVATPSNPDGIWKNLIPFFLGYGIGKNYQEVYSVEQKEQDFIDAFNAAVIAFEIFHPMERSTGQQATVNPSPPPADLIAAYDDVEDALVDLVLAVQAYDSFLSTMSSNVFISDFDLIRQTQSIAAKNYIDNTIRPAIALWLSYNDFNTAHGQVTSFGFYNYDTSLLQPTKGNPIQLDVLKDIVSNRNTYIDNTRKPELISYLGNVSQDISNGEITAQSGLYGGRALGIVIRINTIGGSLTKINGLNNALKAQDNIINAGELSQDGYDLLIKVSKFKAPASNSKTVHVKDSSLFSIGDSVYVCADGQEELFGSVANVSGTRVDLTFNVPQKYTTVNNARLYKLV